jgi:glycolate oxidase FAD binding subunit
VSDRVQEEIAERIRSASADKRALRIRGGGTKDFYGQSLDGDPLDTGGMSGIVDYEPTELVVTARAGTPLSVVESTLRERGQQLGFEPPHFGAKATIGGAVASGLSGPRRPYAGAARDFVLGVRLIDGAAQSLAFGGRVIKNVAGFDVARLMTGALGTLGVLTEVSLKCLPLPRYEATLALEGSADDSIRHSNEWGGRPLPLSATCYHDGRMCVRLSGAESAVRAAANTIGGETLGDADAFWESVREQTHAFFTAARDRDAALWRLSVKSTAPYTDLGGEQLIEWGGALRWLAAPSDTDAGRLRAWAKSNGGHATLFRAGDKSAGVFQTLPAPIFTLHQRLKRVFDPAGIFNRERLYAGL